MNYYLYKFLNTDNETIYIGKSKRPLPTRFAGHDHLPKSCYDETVRGKASWWINFAGVFMQFKEKGILMLTICTVFLPYLQLCIHRYKNERLVNESA